MGTYYLDNKMNKYLGGSVSFQFKIHENKYQTSTIPTSL